ncbi:Hypothetical predicted protein [Podarcis lilfordi]|uniref:Uncharacterized protein n=1 Tax=Podarcis lilfordi TaxID=74358 RepID=A0AA35NVN6_9SAUR|nr:Hypothetical predicted protein [Podarcis lilfordi]
MGRLVNQALERATHSHGELLNPSALRAELAGKQFCGERQEWELGCIILTSVRWALAHLPLFHN